VAGGDAVIVRALAAVPVPGGLAYPLEPQE
jgi:hypothetical protein